MCCYAYCVPYNVDQDSIPFMVIKCDQMIKCDFTGSHDDVVAIYNLSTQILWLMKCRNFVVNS